MSSIGWTQSVKASSVLDKIQNVHQTQEESAQVHAKAKALQKERLRQTTVGSTPDSEKIRLRDEQDRRKEGDRKKRPKKNEEESSDEHGTSEENGTSFEEEGCPRKIDITV